MRIISPDGREIIRETTSTSTGAFSYTFTPDTVGKWSVQASWPGDEDYLGATSEWVSFEVIPKKYIVVIDTSPPGLPVIIDGTEYRGEYR